MTALGQGVYYPRIWRPRINAFDNLPDVVHDRADTRIAVRRLEVLTEEIFSVIQPADQRNHEVYGHRIRELLLLACTEVENAWRGVLIANNYKLPGKKKRLDANDYMKLKAILALDEWSLRLSDYPSTPTLSPFALWTDKDPAKSLKWHDAYNSAKHDRRRGFDRATLWCAVEAVAAAWIMYGAQFGPHWIDLESRLFSIQEHPFRANTAAGYIAPLSISRLSIAPQNYPFP